MENGKYKIQEKPKGIFNFWRATYISKCDNKHLPLEFDGLFIKYEDAEFVLTNIMFKESQEKEKETVRSIIKVYE